MKISTTTGTATLRRGRWGLHGPGGIGKTTFAYGADRPFFVATELRHEHIAADLKYKHVTSSDEWVKVVDWLDKDKCRRRYGTIVVDVIDDIYQYDSQVVCKKLNIDHPSDERWAKAYQMIDDRFKMAFLQLTSYKDYMIIFISHTKKDDLRFADAIRNKMIPGLSPRGWRIVKPKLGIVAYLDNDLIKVKKKSGKSTYVTRRCLHFEDSELFEAKEGEGRLPEIMQAHKDSVKTWKKIRKYYGEE